MNYDPMYKLRGSSHLLRRVLIFLAVLAVSGGVVYCIVPHEAKKTLISSEASGKAEAPAEAATAAPSGSVPVEKAVPVETSADEKSEETVSETIEAATEVPTKNPVKGVPWQGDPVVDVPEKPVSAETVDAEQTLTLDNWRQVEEGADAWCIRHAVSRGDNLERLANRYHTTVALIKDLNHLKGNTIFLGRKLTIVPGPWRIEVSKSARRLQLFNLAKKKTLFAAYDVGVGRADSTPADEFVISIRVFHPDYHAPNGTVYAYGDPDNPMGDYFLKLAKAAQQERPLAGYGIHGSPEDAGVGRSLSHGCVRMRNQDVRQLYLLCPVGTPVSITE